jgi:cystathionine beta-lyase/cystathionine gamma-synthase
MLFLLAINGLGPFERGRDYEYTRTANPSRDMLADTLAKLEGGVGAVVTASAMAAITLCCPDWDGTSSSSLCTIATVAHIGHSPLGGTEDSSMSPTLIRTTTWH